MIKFNKTSVTDTDSKINARVTFRGSFDRDRDCVIITAKDGHGDAFMDIFGFQNFIMIPDGHKFFKAAMKQADAQDS